MSKGNSRRYWSFEHSKKSALPIEGYEKSVKFTATHFRIQSFRVQCLIFVFSYATQYNILQGLVHLRVWSQIIRFGEAHIGSVLPHG